MRRYARSLGLLGLATLVAAIAVLIALHAPPVQRAVLRRALDQAAKAGLDLTVGSLDYHLIDRSVELRDVRIAAKGSEPFATIRTAEVRWRYAGLAAGLDLIESVEAEGVALRFAKDAAGNWNLPKSQGGGKPLAGLPRAARLKDVTLRYDDGAVRAELPASTVTLDGGRWAIDTPAGARVSAEGTVATLEHIGLSGVVTNVNEPLDGFTATGALAATVTGIRQAGTVRANSRIDFEGSGMRLALGGIEVDSALGALSGDAKLALEAGESEASGTVRRREGTARFALQWPAMRWREARGSGEARVTMPEIRGGVGFTLANETIRATPRGLTAYGTTVEGGATLGLVSQRLGGELRGRYPIPALEGVAEWRAEVSGTVASPIAAATARVPSLSYGPVEGAAAFARAEYRDRKIEILEAQAEWAGQTATAAGTIDVAGKQPLVALTASVEEADLAKALDAVESSVPAAGTISVNATATGSIDDPQVEFTATATDLLAYGEQWGAASAKGGYRDGRATLDSLVLEKPQSTGVGEVRGNGFFDPETRAYGFEAESASLALESLTLGATGRKIAGRVEFRATGEGTIDDPKAQAALRIETTAGRIVAAGTVTDRTARVTAETEALSLAEFGLNGEAAAKASAIVPLDDPGAALVTATVPRLTLRVADETITAAEPIEVRFENRELRAIKAELAVAEGRLRIAGSLPLETARSGSQFTVEGEASLEIAKRYLPPELELKIDGSARIAGTVSGTLLEPEPRARIESRASVVQAKGMQRPMTDVAANVTVDRRKLSIESVEAKLDQGTIRASGEIGLDGAMSKAVVEIESVDPLPFVLPTPRIPARVGARIEVAARELDLKAIVATAVFSQLRLGRIEQTEPARLSLRDGVLTVDSLDVKGGLTEIRARGSAALTGERKLALRVDGTADAQILSNFVDVVEFAGPVEAHLDVGGTLDTPRVRGAAELRDGRIVSLDPPLDADRVNARAAFDGGVVRIEKLEAQVNGGRVTGSGSVEVAGDVRNVDLRLKGESVYLEYPRGLQTASNLDVTAKSDGRSIVVGGTVTVLDGVYREGINLAAQAVSRAGGAPTLRDSAGPSLLDRVRFDLNVTTRQPIALDNNLARVNADANLRLRGTPDRPGLLGRFELEEGGQLYFSERTFSITRATIDFTDETSVRPNFNVNAQTTVGAYDVTLSLTGDIDRPETNLTAPGLSQDQVLTLLFTGSPETRGNDSTLVQRQALSLFGSSVSGGLTTRLRNAIGLSEFRIEPGLIAADADPTARLTLGQNLTPELKLTYSSNLADSNDQIWIGEYNWRRRFLARFVQQADTSNRGEIRQKFRFGGGPNTGDMPYRKRESVRVSSVEVKGDLGFPESEILRRLGVKKGAKYDFIRSRKAIDRLRKFYASRGYLEARVSEDRTRGGAETAVEFTIDAGPKVEFVYEGRDVPRAVKNRAERAWQQGIVDAQRSRAVSILVRDWLVSEKYFDAKASTSVRSSPGGERVLVEIDAGTKYERVELVFEGASPADQEDLEEEARRLRLDRIVKTDPRRFRETLETYLRDYAYLAGKIGEPRIETPGGGVFRAVIPTNVGPEFLYGETRFEGNAQVPAADLLRTVYLDPGDPYYPEDRLEIERRVQLAYFRRGFRRAEVIAEEKLDADKARVDLALRIDEGPESRVAQIRIEGLSATSEAFVKRRMTLYQGAALSNEAVNQSRKNLLDSGAYTMLDIDSKPVTDPAGAAAAAVQPVEVTVHVREVKPYRIDGGASYDSERGAGFISDIATQNRLGEARTLGFRTLVDRIRQEYRLYYSQPFLGTRRVSTTSALTVEREKFDFYDFEGLEASVQLTAALSRRWRLSGGYSHNRGTIAGEFLFLPFRIQSSWSAAVFSGSRDTRDEVLDATRGSFVSQTFEYGPQWLGGSIGYYKYYGQAFKYFPLRKPAIMPFAREKRPRWVFATGFRAGVQDGLSGSTILPSELFFGGGGTTVRGYERNSLGPRGEGAGSRDGALGGRATMILNNELRFPVYKWIDGVAFHDAGNVFATPSQLSFGDLRQGAGFGLRVRNPFVLLRFDYGWKVGRRPGESAGAFFFSIGQAF